MPAKPKDIRNSFLKRLMAEKGFSNIQQAAEHTGLPYTSLIRFAETEQNTGLLAHVRAAEAFGVPLEQWVRGISGEAL